MLLAGDVGGTKTRLAAYSLENGKLKRTEIERYESKAFSGLDQIARAFVEKRKLKVEAACFGVPGPVIAGNVKLPNLPWELSETQLSKSLSIPRVKLVNDLVATAAAIPHLAANELMNIYPGRPQKEQRVYAVVAPGTGLGHAFLYVEDGKYHVIASEGGHMDFAPTDDLQIELLNFLRRKFGHVSVERLICGPGLANIYAFLRDSGKAAESAEVKRRMATEDPGAVIAQTALDGSSELSGQAMDLFISILGAHCGNVVLMNMATAGLYLGGGIPPKISKKFSDPKFIAGFTNKGRFAEVVGATPINMIVDDHAAVVGAASIASQLLSSVRIKTSS